MSDINEKLLARLQKLEREVERLRVGEKINKALLDTYYLGITAKAADSDKLDGNDSTYFQQNLADYTAIELGYNMPADSPAGIDFHTIADKKNYDARILASGGLAGSGNEGKANLDYIAATHTFNTIPILPSTNPTSTNHAVRKGYADATYLGITAKAADSDKLDGNDSTAFLLDNGWQSYTPTWTASTTNPTLGNGTLTGKYIQIGKLVVLNISFTFGSTTAFGTGDHYLSLPVEAASGLYDGSARFRDTGIANYARIAGIATSLSSTKITLFTSLTGNDNNWTPTIPFAMGNGDTLVIQIVYQRT